MGKTIRNTFSLIKKIMLKKLKCHKIEQEINLQHTRLVKFSITIFQIILEYFICLITGFNFLIKLIKMVILKLLQVLGHVNLSLVNFKCTQHLQVDLKEYQENGKASNILREDVWKYIFDKHSYIKKHLQLYKKKKSQ